ncbi:MAG: hypothetical protein ACXWPM_00045 [Bdellovibrionota bacterium]
MKVTAPLSTDELLAAMRLGKDQELWLKIGDKEIPCRILSHSDESSAMARGKKRALEKEPSGKVDLGEQSAEVMKAVLFAATNVKSVQYLATEFLNRLSGAALDSLYDQYVSLMREVNPQFEKLSVERLGEIITSVKKKEKAPRDFFTWELAAIGRSYLEEIQLQASAPGR